MKNRYRTLFSLASLILLLKPTFTHASEPLPANLSGFDTYSQQVEVRIAMQHRSSNNFLALSAATQTQLRQTSLAIEDLTPTTQPAGFKGALLHHWRGTTFVPHDNAADFEHLIRNFNAYPQNFAPEVMQAIILTQSPNRMLATMRIRQRHVITVVLDTTYDITFGQLNPTHGYSISRSTHIDELDNKLRVISPADSHGFLWRQNTYWSYEERDGGLYLQIESLSLTRAVPTGLGWAVGPYIDSIPRESLEFTLQSAARAITPRYPERKAQ